MSLYVVYRNRWGYASLISIKDVELDNKASFGYANGELIRRKAALRRGASKRLSGFEDDLDDSHRMSPTSTENTIWQCISDIRSD